MLVSLFGYCRFTGSFFGFVIVCLSLYDSAVKLLAELSVYAILFLNVVLGLNHAA